MEKTILVTGGTGYIGAWVVKKLLDKGYKVILTLRNKSKIQSLVFLKEISEKFAEKIEFVEADLLKEGDFDEPASRSDAIIHVASPFKLTFKDPVAELINPAVKGTQNVLNAANKSERVKKVVLTSSVAAVHGDNKDMTELGIEEFTEENFNQTSSVKHQPYSFSKVTAEKEAWKIAEQQDKWKLVVINPSFVMGPSLVGATNSGSFSFMTDLLSGKYSMAAPELYFGFVDVRDVAEAHILALENDDAEGRHILSVGVMNIKQLSDLIEKLYPNRFKLPKAKAPKFLLLMIGWSFGLTTKFVSRNIGWPLKLSNKKSIEKLGLKYAPTEKIFKDMIDYMIENKIIN